MIYCTEAGPMLHDVAAYWEFFLDQKKQKAGTPNPVRKE